MGPSCDGQRDHANGSRERTQPTTALEQSALLELLEVLKGVEVEDRIRRAAETLYQALIEAELTTVIGAFPHQRTETRTRPRNGYRPRTITTTAGGPGAEDPAAAGGVVLPVAARAAVGRSVAVRRDHRNLPARHLDQESG